jgi:hypothetical protein
MHFGLAIAKRVHRRRQQDGAQVDWMRYGGYCANEGAFRLSIGDSYGRDRNVPRSCRQPDGV